MQEEKQTEVKKNINSFQTGLKQTPKQPIKKKKKISGAVVFSIFLVAVIIALFAAIYFDLGGAKQIAVSMLKLESAPAQTDEESAAKQTELEQRSAALDKRDTELDEREDALDTKEDELGTKEQDLKQRETAVAEGEKRISDQKEEYLVSAAKIYEGMDAKKAASAISGLKTKEDMVLIFLHMNTEKASLIMNQMSQKLASAILSEILKANK